MSWTGGFYDLLDSLDLDSDSSDAKADAKPGSPDANKNFAGKRPAVSASPHGKRHAQAFPQQNKRQRTAAGASSSTSTNPQQGRGSSSSHNSALEAENAKLRRRLQKYQQEEAGLIAVPASITGKTVKQLKFPPNIVDLLKRRDLLQRIDHGIALNGGRDSWILKLEQAKLIASQENDDAFDSEEENWNDADEQSGEEDAPGYELPDMPLPKRVGDMSFFLQPGDKGYNDFVRKKLKTLKLYGDGLLKPHQRIVRFTAKTGDCPRQLLDHQTGSGKTLLQIKILEDDFSRGRTKVVIVPKRAHVDNFIGQMLRWQNTWRTFFANSNEDLMDDLFPRWRETVENQREQWDWWSSLTKEKVREVFSKFRDTIGLKGKIRNGRIRRNWAKDYYEKHGVHAPSAPLRIFNYASAGGRAIGFDKNGYYDEDIDPCLRFKLAGPSGDERKANPLRGKLIVMDEAHNLTKAKKGDRFYEQLTRLRERVQNTSASDGTWVFLATATPPIFMDGDGDARSFMDVVKGEGRPDRNQEGFHSSYHTVSADMPRVCCKYEESIGTGLKLAGLSKIALQGRALGKYVWKDCFDVKSDDPGRLQKLSVSAVCAVPPAHVSRSREGIIQSPEEWIPKCATVAQMIEKKPVGERKALVMVARPTGFLACKLYLEHRFPGKVAEISEKENFNSATNLRGDDKLIMLVTREECAEGVEFIAVRDHHILDVPDTVEQFLQMCGRTVRQGSHKALPKAERTVQIHLHVAMIAPDHRQMESMVLALAKDQKYGRNNMAEGLKLWEKEKENKEDGEPLSTADALDSLKEKEGKKFKGVKLTNKSLPQKSVDEHKLDALEKNIKQDTDSYATFRKTAYDAGWV